MNKNIRKRITSTGAGRWIYEQEHDIRNRVHNPSAIGSRNNVAGMVEAYLTEVKGVHKSYKDTAARCNFFVGINPCKANNTRPGIERPSADN